MGGRIKTIIVVYKALKPLFWFWWVTSNHKTSHVMWSNMIQINIKRILGSNLQLCTCPPEECEGGRPQVYYWHDIYSLDARLFFRLNDKAALWRTTMVANLITFGGLSFVNQDCCCIKTTLSSSCCEPRCMVLVILNLVRDKMGWKF